MKIVVYTLPYAVKNEANKINQLFDIGLEELHIRKQGFSKDDLFSLLSGVQKEYHSKIVLHQQFDLMNKFGLKGLHLPENFFNGLIGSFRKIKYLGKKNFQLSTTICDVKNVESLDTGFDLVFVGPMYKKFSEQNSLTNFDAFEVKSAISNTTKKVFAFGGIDFKNQSRMNSLGFKGIVLQGSIWKSGDAVNAFHAFLLNQSELDIGDRSMRIA